MQTRPSTQLLPFIDGIPGPVELLSVLLFITFTLHLLFMNALVGVAAITFVSKLRALLPRRRLSGPDDDVTLALDTPGDSGPVSGRTSGNGGRPEYTQDTLLPKVVAMTINLGIPPFLFMQCLFAQYIYVSSVLMAQWWLSVMLVVMLAYYGMYLNMARNRLSDNARTVALGLSLALLLLNAFLFVNNMTLLQNPERWSVYAVQSGGNFLNLADPQVLPRYLHIVLSCLAVGGLCLALPAEYALRGKSSAFRPSAAADRHTAKRSAALSWFIHASLLQIPAGLWFFLSLAEPQQRLFMGEHGTATFLFGAALLFLAAALLLAWRRQALAAAICSLPVILCMAGMRTILRASMLASSYHPEVRPFEAGSFFLFLSSLIIAAWVLFRLGKVYLRGVGFAPAPPKDMVPSVHGSAEAGEAFPPAQALTPSERRETLLVLEIPSRRPDEHDGGNGNGRPAGRKNGGRA